MRINDVKVGDTVEFELSSRFVHSQFPRWDFRLDTGSSGIMMQAKVSQVFPKSFEIDYKDNMGRRVIWEFPTGGINYPGDNMQGWPKIVNSKANRCECGAEIARTTHSYWCPKFI